MTKVFIDGSAGTTGLRVFERLSARSDISLITLKEEVRKDINARKEALNSADVAFLCLPDAAAVEAVSLIENNNTCVIDTSTAHRTNDSFVYGMPELKGFREKIVNSKRIANPGCHATGFISLIAPLVKSGIIKKEAVLSCFSLTGYSGGGKKMIAEYEASERDSLLAAPRMYGLSGMHKHLPEMSKICGLDNAPIFAPVVAPFYSGMQVSVTLSKEQINCGIEDLKRFYKEYYQSGVIKFNDSPDENGFMSANKLAGKDSLEISVIGNNDRIILVSRFDNLGKGASGAAIQNMNLVLGFDECAGLEV